MQKTLTNVEACGIPSVRQPGCTPVSVMVSATGWPNAPELLCLHVVNIPVVHWLSAVQGWGGFSNVEGEWAQKPQKTEMLEGRSCEVFVCAPVESENGIGRLPMNGGVPLGGGQSWLVG